MLSSKPEQQQRDQTTTPGTTFPTLCEGVCEKFNVPCDNHITLKMQETGPTIFRPYPRRLECLTICRCKYKGSAFSSVVRSGFRTLPHDALPTELTGRLFILETTTRHARPRPTVGKGRGSVPRHKGFDL